MEVVSCSNNVLPVSRSSPYWPSLAACLACAVSCPVRFEWIRRAEQQRNICGNRHFVRAFRVGFIAVVPGLWLRGLDAAPLGLDIGHRRRGLFGPIERTQPGNRQYNLSVCLDRRGNCRRYPVVSVPTGNQGGFRPLISIPVQLSFGFSCGAGIHPASQSRKLSAYPHRHVLGALPCLW